MANDSVSAWTRARRSLVAAAALAAVIVDFNGHPTRYFTYFTVLTNLGIGLWFAAAAVTARWERASGLRLALTVYGLTTLLVYWVFLSPTHHPQGWAAVANVFLHLVIPLCMAAEDLIVPQPASRQAALCCLGFPALYAAFSLVRGQATGWYPYFFFNVNKWEGGWPDLALFLAALLGLFVVLAFGWRLAVRFRFRFRLQVR